MHLFSVAHGEGEDQSNLNEETRINQEKLKEDFMEAQVSTPVHRPGPYAFWKLVRISIIACGTYP
jgi:hypothetical protein